jgi:hypothetical protein
MGGVTNPALRKVQITEDVLQETKIFSTPISEFNRKKGLTFVWFGQEHQCVELFHKRLILDLRKKLHEFSVLEVNPKWPKCFHDYYCSSFNNMLSRVFEVGELQDIPHHVMSKINYPERKSLIYFKLHFGIQQTTSQLMNDIRICLEWWDSEFVPLLKKQQFVLLGISFEHHTPAECEDSLDEARFDELELRNTYYWRLDELTSLLKRDIFRFMHDFNITIPHERKKRVVNIIMKKTDGICEQVLDTLEEDFDRIVWNHYDY